MSTDPERYSVLFICTGNSVRTIRDPAVVEGNDIDKHQVIADYYRMLRTRISHLLNLPIPSVDRVSLKLRLDGIESSSVRSA